MSTISSLIGRRARQESTTTSAMPAQVSATIPPVGVSRFQHLRRRKKPVREAGAGGLIPNDAEALDPTTGLVKGDPDSQDGREGDGIDLGGAGDEGADDGPSDELLPLSLALVAPNTTPAWDKPLSPTLVPTEQAAPVTATTPTKAGDEMSVASMIGLGRNKVSPTASTNVSIPGITDALVEKKTPDELVAQGRPMPDHQPSNAGAKSFGRFRFND